MSNLIRTFKKILSNENKWDKKHIEYWKDDLRQKAQGYSKVEL